MTTKEEKEMSGNMVIHTTPAPGWVGGFMESNPAFEYPNPDLTSLPVLGNLDNIDKLDRQMKVLWPEFSWRSKLDDESSRCFQMFAPDISRLGYTNEGRVYSIICPQQGAYSDIFGAFNVEVTVTGQRGWANESARPAEMMAADLSVVGTIWFSNTPIIKNQLDLLAKYAEHKFKGTGYKFPFSKENAIHIQTHKVGNPKEPLFALRTGLSERFTAPSFTRHDDQAFAVSNLDVEIGAVVKTGNKAIDAFNQAIVNLFNVVKGNILTEGNILTWNVWFEAPTIVDQKEWANHAEYWRTSIETDHGSPGGEESKVRHADGTVFHPILELVQEAVRKLMHYTEQTDALVKGLPYERDMSGNMVIHKHPAPGWIGGFVDTNPAFKYPNPDLSSLEVFDNMDHIFLLDRQMKVLWPEFSWQSVVGNEKSRCFQMFAPDISRLGYTDEGRVYSIICPQQGAYSKLFGAMNVEVTVTGQRGWANESASVAEMMAADMSVVGQIWFSETQEMLPLLKKLRRYAEIKFAGKGYNFPISKKYAIKVRTHKVGNPAEVLFPLRTGLAERFVAPSFTRHDDQAFAVSCLDVEIGDIISTGNSEIDHFNRAIMKLFNAVKGNVLTSGNILTWNVWFEAPTHVDRKEWKNHADYWRHSLETDHGSPGGPESKIRYADGTEFKPILNMIQQAVKQLKHYTDRVEQLEFGFSYSPNQFSEENLITVPAPGWIGGFSTSHRELLYPNPDLSVLKFDKSHENSNLFRSLGVNFPEVSWQRIFADEKTRCFSLCNQEISRINYSSEGEVIESVGVQYYPSVEGYGMMNVEFSFEKCRGWVDEGASPAQLLYVELIVVIRVWFNSVGMDNTSLSRLKNFAVTEFRDHQYSFPDSRENAIMVSTHKVGDPSCQVISIKSGLSERFCSSFAKEYDSKSFAKSYLEFEIGSVLTTDCYEVDAFNQKIIRLASASSLNMLESGKILTVSLYLNAPALTNLDDIASHKQFWFSSKTNQDTRTFYEKYEIKGVDKEISLPDISSIKSVIGSLDHYVNDSRKDFLTGKTPVEKVRYSKLLNYAAPGWKGGFEESNPDFSYPNPNLSTLLMTSSVDGVNRIERRMKIRWPEFSWRSNLEEEDSRCFQMFSPELAKLGYTKEGSIKAMNGTKSIAYSELLGCFNFEFIVTEQRGWVNEAPKDSSNMAADLNVVAALWFDDSAKEKPYFKKLFHLAKKRFDNHMYKFPLSRADAIIVETHKVGERAKDLVSLTSGTSELFATPNFSKHSTNAFCVCSVDFQIGNIRAVRISEVNDFHQVILDVFNSVKGNVLAKGNIITWNAWFEAPCFGRPLDWETHSKYWKISNDENHALEHNKEYMPKFENGKFYEPNENEVLDAETAVYRLFGDSKSRGENLKKEIKTANETVKRVSREAKEGVQEMFEKVTSRIEEAVESALSKARDKVKEDSREKNETETTDLPEASTSIKGQEATFVAQDKDTEKHLSTKSSLTEKIPSQILPKTEYKRAEVISEPKVHVPPKPTHPVALNSKLETKTNNKKKKKKKKKRCTVT